MTTIIGVDFSGAKAENKTWIAQGTLTEDRALTMGSVRPITRAGLCELLAGISPPAVAGMDFPFGVPAVFVEYLCPGAGTMPEVWQAVAGMSLDQYKDKCKSFGTHPKRMSDQYDKVSISALNTRLVPMTYHGMKMLLQLRNGDPSRKRYRIPPIDSGNPCPNAVTLLEVMPGAALKARDLSYSDYKNCTGSDPLRNLENRQEILAKLSGSFDIDLPNFQNYRDLFLFNDDALDAYIAAIVAAMWAQDSGRFRHPSTDQELDTARLEGCIYSPR